MMRGLLAGGIIGWIRDSETEPTHMDARRTFESGEIG